MRGNSGGKKGRGWKRIRRRERRASRWIGRRLLSVIKRATGTRSDRRRGGSLFYIRAANTAPGIIPGAKLTDVKFERKAFNPRPASNGVPTASFEVFRCALRLAANQHPPSTRLRSPSDRRFIAESTARNILTKKKPREKPLRRRCIFRTISSQTFRHHKNFFTDVIARLCTILPMTRKFKWAKHVQIFFL